MSIASSSLKDTIQLLPIGQVSYSLLWREGTQCVPFTGMRLPSSMLEWHSSSNMRVGPDSAEVLNVTLTFGAEGPT